MSKPSKKIKLVRLLSNDGVILEKAGYVDFPGGVRDEDGNMYPAGFESDGTVHGNLGDENGNILFAGGASTGYNINENYFSLVCLRIAYKENKKSA